MESGVEEEDADAEDERDRATDERDRATVWETSLPLLRESTRPILSDETSSQGDSPAFFEWIHPGTLLHDSYRILGLLGEGGMGIVLRGIDEVLDREVAIKFIHPKRFETAALRELFLSEARAMARVRHPNLIEIYAYGEHEGSPYFVMEHIEGVRLDSWVANHGELHADSQSSDTSPKLRRLPLDEALSVLDQLCRGISALHTAGAVHRDLKPSNVLIGPGSRVVVADLGLAYPLGEVHVHTLSLAGTPAYIAPEVASRRPIPHSEVHLIDIYSLGVVAYELLTGRLPFQNEDVDALLGAHIHETPLPASEYVPGLPAAFDQVLAQAMAKDPAQRIGSADVLRDALVSARLSRASRPLRILIADDDPACLRWTAKSIAVSFPEVTLDLVSDGEAALEHATREPPTLAIIDLSMPGLNGVELATALQADPRTRDVPVVVITGVGGAKDWRILRELGASGFLVKPIDPDALDATIHRVIG